MDLRLYYQKVRDAQAAIAEAFPVVVSKETQDGGRAGEYAEVTRAVAGKMITEGTARVATPDEEKTYRDAETTARRVAGQVAEASRVQLTIVSSSDLAKLTSVKKDKA